MTKKEMRLKEEVTRAVLSELTSLLTPENKNVVGKNLQEVAKIMAGYSDFNDRGVIGRYDGTFPLSTATKDNVYLEPKTGKYYRCETSYSGGQISAPNSNFVDLSVLANADRFGNLPTIDYSSKIDIDNPINGYTATENGYLRIYLSTSLARGTLTYTINNVEFVLIGNMNEGGSPKLIVEQIVPIAKNDIFKVYSDIMEAQFFKLKKHF